MRIWGVMDDCIRTGVSTSERTLPGRLGLRRRAPMLYRRLMRGSVGCLSLSLFRGVILPLYLGSTLAWELQRCPLSDRVGHPGNPSGPRIAMQKLTKSLVRMRMEIFLALEYLQRALHEW